MKVRFCTSIAGASFSYLEGQTRDLPDPMPPQFLDWLNRGIVEPVKDGGREVALAPADIARVRARRRKGQRETASAAVDAEP